MHKVELTSRARREFDKLSLADRGHLEAVLDHLSANPRPSGMRKIYGNTYRIRSGDWRVIYAIFDKNNIVLVGRIARRSEDTYDRAKDLF